MQSRRFRADIESVSGQRIVIVSTSWQTVALMAPQDRDYREFVTQLHTRMQQAGSKAALIGGIGPKTYIAGLVLLALVGVAIAGLLVRATVTGEFAGGLFLVGFAVVILNREPFAGIALGESREKCLSNLRNPEPRT